MATNFPTSLDSLTNPTASDKLNSVTVPHATQHADINDAVEALEAKVGVNGSSVVTSHDYLIDKQSVVPYADASARTTAVPSPVEGQMSYLEDTNSVEVYDGSAWAAVGGGGGLVFISRTTIGSAVSSVTVSGAFSTDYDNYKIVVSGGTASTSSDLNLTLGSTTTGYYLAGRIINYGATAADKHDQNVAYWTAGIGGTTLSLDVTLYGPYATDRTGFASLFFGTRGDAYEGFLGGYLDDTTSYTAFTLAPSTGTITGGSIDVYGYAKA